MGLLYTADLPTPSDPGVRSTVSETPDVDTPAVAPSAPAGPNMVARDTEDTGGLQPRNTASYVEPRRQAANVGNPSAASVSALDDSGSSKGVAAAKEASGHWGRGTLPLYDGIEPAYQDNAFTDVYFLAGERDLQAGTRRDVTGPRVPGTARDAGALSATNENARAARGAAYDAWLSVRS